MKDWRQLGVALWASAVVLAGMPASAADKVVGVYFTEWSVYDRNYHVTNLPAAQLTHVFYAFARPVCSTGTDTAHLELLDGYAATNKEYPGDSPEDPFWGSFNQLVKLKQRAPHLKTLLSVGGWTDSDDFSDIAASSNARSTFVESCVTFVTNYGFDGVDLDWEYPVTGGEDGLKHRSADITNFVFLVRDIRDAFDRLKQQTGRDYLLTIAAAADPSSVSTYYAVTNLLDSIDWFNLMTYDYTGPWDDHTGHEAAWAGNPSSPHPLLCASKAIEAFTNQGASLTRLVCGLPFYGRGFKGVPATNNGLFQTYSGVTDEGSWEAGAFDYGDLKNGTRGHAWIDQNGFTRHWDSIAIAPYLYNPTSHLFVTYDDPESIQTKVTSVRQAGLKGVMVWSIDADTRDHELIGVIYNSLYPSGTNTFKFTAVALTNNVCLRWTDPTECGWSNRIVLLRYTTLQYPSNTTDGFMCYTGPEQFFEHANLTPSQTYYYTIWASHDGASFTNP